MIALSKPEFSCKYKSHLAAGHVCPLILSQPTEAAVPRLSCQAICNLVISFMGKPNNQKFSVFSAAVVILFPEKLETNITFSYAKFLTEEVRITPQSAMKMF